MMVVVVVVAFSSLARILEECSTIHSPPALFFFFGGGVGGVEGKGEWELARVHSFHSLCQDQSTVAQRAETTVAKCSLKCSV